MKVEIKSDSSEPSEIDAYAMRELTKKTLKGYERILGRKNLTEDKRVRIFSQYCKLLDQLEVYENQISEDVMDRNERAETEDPVSLGESFYADPSRQLISKSDSIEDLFWGTLDEDEEENPEAINLLTYIRQARR